MTQNQTEIYSLKGREVTQVYPTLGEPLPTRDAVEVIGRVSLEAVPILFTIDELTCFEVHFRDFADGIEDGPLLSGVDLSNVPEANHYQTLARHVDERYEPGQTVLVTGI